MKQDIAYYREQIMQRAENPSHGHIAARKNPYRTMPDRSVAGRTLARVWDALHTRIYRMREFH
ncbi:MAG: hypothetical protein JST83_12235 [Bacteroidetes bacterium]|nr:hypothetical protein [Bacteroidota bacterium]